MLLRARRSYRMKTYQLLHPRLQILEVESHYLPALNQVNRRGNSVRYEPQAWPVIGGQDNNC